MDSTLVKWIRDYLSGRSHRVLLNNIFSDSESVLSGVPQGSVLGPLLFLIYINDLPDNVLSTLRLFADDGLLSKVITSAADALILQSDLNSCQDWADKWLLKYNVSKCEVMRVTRKHSPLLAQYCLNDTPLNIVTSYKYLGIHLDSKLTLNTQVTEVTKKAMNMLYFIHRNLKKSTPLVRERSYNIFVKPILEYAAAAWDPFTLSANKSIERVQRKAIRIVTHNFDYSKSTDELLIDRNWTSLELRRKIARLTTLHKCKSGYPGLQSINSVLQEPHYSSSRLDNNFKIREIRARTDQFKNSFLPRTIRDWNILPNNVFGSDVLDGICNLNEFKNNLMLHFSSQESLLN